MSLIAEFELYESLVEDFLKAHCGSKKVLDEVKRAQLLMLVAEYLEWYVAIFGRQPKIHPLKNRFQFLRMRKRKSSIPISAVA